MSTVIWQSKDTTPRSKGWYVTRREDGELHWRAWGNGGWWKQLKGGGWIEWFDGDGNPARHEWVKESRQSIDLDDHQLPRIETIIK